MKINIRNWLKNENMQNYMKKKISLSEKLPNITDETGDGILRILAAV